MGMHDKWHLWYTVKNSRHHTMDLLNFPIKKVSLLKEGWSWAVKYASYTSPVLSGPVKLCWKWLRIWLKAHRLGVTRAAPNPNLIHSSAQAAPLRFNSAVISEAVRLLCGITAVKNAHNGCFENLERAFFPRGFPQQLTINKFVLAETHNATSHTGTLINVCKFSLSNLFSLSLLFSHLQKRSCHSR